MFLKNCLLCPDYLKRNTQLMLEHKNDNNVQFVLIKYFYFNSLKTFPKLVPVLKTMNFCDMDLNAIKALMLKFGHIICVNM